VEDRKGRLVSNLQKEDFRITEDNVPQKVRYFWRGTDAPLTIGIVVDTSPSQGSVLGIEQEQAKMLLHEVLRPHDSGFVIHFDERVELLQNLTDDQGLLARAIDATAIREPEYVASSQVLSPTQPRGAVGGSHLYDTICFASKLTMNQVGRNVLILLTDGEDVGSTAKLETALEAAEKANLIIYAVAVTDRTFYEDRGLKFNGNSVLKKFSLATGGRMSRGKDALSTAAAFKQIGGELRGQYLLRYTPSKKGDGSFRTIQVAVNHGNYKVRARRGYYAEPE
jgi:VWFA-related protein